MFTIKVILFIIILVIFVKVNLFDNLEYIESKKCRALEDGYYLISIGNKYGYSNGYFINGRICKYIGEYKDGIMRDMVTGIVLNYYDDIDIHLMINNSRRDMFFEFSSPCYVKSEQISEYKLLDYLNLIKNNGGFFKYSDKLCSELNKSSYRDLGLEPDYVKVGKKVFELRQKHIIE